MTELAIKEKIITTNKSIRLVLGVFFDAIGYVSYLVPFLGEFSDIVWAPIAGILLKSMYKGTIGTVGGIFAFAEELMPGMDFIPTFTLTWIYTYWIKKQN